MLTRLELDGFKTFRNFALDFQPFMVFIGPNGVGKTNLFDAITLLARLAEGDSLEEAMSHARGEPAELFTLHADGTRAERMQIAAELLLERESLGANGKPFAPTNTRLRYELTLERRGEGAHIVAESLLPLQESRDSWVKDHIPTKARKAWIVREKRPPYIATVGEEGELSIYRNQDTLAGGREGLKVGDLRKSALGTADPIRYPTIHAVRQAMRNWRLLRFNPEVLRQPCAATAEAKLQPDGANLPAVIARLLRDQSEAIADITAALQGMLPHVKAIEVKTLSNGSRQLIELVAQDGTRFSSRVLSDGTLRLLGLAALRYDATHHGVICYEEPENGIQLLRLADMVNVLFGLALNLEREVPDGTQMPPLRQALINTHSPSILSNVPRQSVYYFGLRTDERGQHTYAVEVRPELIPDEQERYRTWLQIQQELSGSAQ
ncbi:MAG: AAA family ATPase [Anaerolineae bacterium]|nr:AAA family ATPase [Anaerolineae bacterium]